MSKLWNQKGQVIDSDAWSDFPFTVVISKFPKKWDQTGNFERIPNLYLEIFEKSKISRQNSKISTNKN